ncbi:MAG TPA: NAD(P)-dependent oxidoreductase [Candidatus Limnocylindria bacterium]|jgi:nucleoside-diphosphate-sugar epimerase|nr:NAD(P)-dependent oxidoreductase [Candidatus Limnocylindria bacterium]
MRVLVTGAGGFIAGYLIPELLAAGHEVIGLDNESKYGAVRRSFDGHARYRFVRGDAKDAGLLTRLALECDQIVAGAAMIGGIAYFHDFAYDLLAENERITAATFDAAIAARRDGRLQRIVVMSSSMVFESTAVFPTPEGAERTGAPPLSTYGFQKLATEYFARGAWEQYALPFTIVRPFNCVGIGERRPLRAGDMTAGNRRQALSHVVPDLVQRVLAGQDPLHILGDGGQVRHYTYGGDIARGIRLAMDSPDAINEDFNISSSEGITVLDLAGRIWRKLRGDAPLRIVHDEPLTYDVQRRVPDVTKARRVLGFVATTSLDRALDEVIAWLRAETAAGAA